MKQRKWVIEIDCISQPYFQIEFCGGTYDIEQATRYDVKPCSTIGKAVLVDVETIVKRV